MRCAVLLTAVLLAGRRRADHFDDFRRAGPLLLPFRHTITLRPWSDSIVHRNEIEAVR